MAMERLLPTQDLEKNPKNKKLSKLQEDLGEFNTYSKIRGEKLKIMCFRKALLLS